MILESEGISPTKYYSTSAASKHCGVNKQMLGYAHRNRCTRIVRRKGGVKEFRNKTNDLILNLTPENVTQHSRIVTTTRKGSSTPTKMSKIIGRQIH